MMLRRERAYAKTLRYADFAGARIERIFVNETMHEAIRFAAMKDAETMYLRPLDVREDELLVLLGEALAADVFTPRFVAELHAIIASRYAQRKAGGAMVEYADVKGYVYAPPEDGLPYVGVVISPGDKTWTEAFETEKAAQERTDEVVMLSRHKITTDRSM